MKVVLLVVASALLAVLAGCGGGNTATPTGSVIFAVVPSVGGSVANHIYGENWSGPAGRYSFALVSGVGTVVSGRGGGSSTPPKYGFVVTQVSSFEGGSVIGTVTPNSEGAYGLGPSSCYKVMAGEEGELDFTPVAECKIRTDTAAQ